MDQPTIPRLNVSAVSTTALEARLPEYLHMPASRAIALHFVRAMQMPDGPAPVHVGIDDRAIGKKYSYGAFMVDLDRHRVVNLLPDCIAAMLAGWFEQRPGIEVVARYRSTEYVRGGNLGAPHIASLKNVAGY